MEKVLCLIIQMRKELAVVGKVFLYNMKKATLILFAFFLCNLINGQKQVVEKNYTSEYDELYKEVSINSGKPIFVVVYASNSYPNDSLIAVREFNELKKNFKNCNFYFLQSKGKINFNNSAKQKLLFDDPYDSPEKVVYWDGKKESQVVEYDYLIESSEFFSDYFEESKTSSYAIAYKNTIKEYKQQFVWKPNSNSRELSNKYIKSVLFEQLYLSKEFSQFLNLDFKGVKKLVIDSNLNDAKNPWQEIYFNTEGLPTKAIVSTDDSDGKKSTVLFEYKDNLLSKITVSYKTEDNETYEYFTDFYYSNDNLITADDLRIEFYTLTNGFLTYKSYYMNTRNLDFLIDTYQLTAKNRLEFKESSGLNNLIISFNAAENFFPVTNILRPEETGDSKYVSVLTKTDDLNYAISLKNKVYRKIKYINKNLISEVLLIDPDDIGKTKNLKQYKFEFKYEYYK